MIEFYKFISDFNVICELLFKINRFLKLHLKVDSSLNLKLFKDFIEFAACHMKD